MRIRALMVILLAVGLVGCSQTGRPTSKNRAGSSPVPMSVTARIRNVYPAEVEFARGSIWVLAGVNGPNEMTPVVRIDPDSNRVIARIDPGNGYISGGGWQMADDPTGLWIVMPTMSNPPDAFGPGPVPKDIQTVYTAGHRIRADLNNEAVAGGLALIDPATNRVRRRIMFLDWTPTSVVSTTAGLWIAAGDRSGGILALMDPRTGVFRSVRAANDGMLRTGFGSLWMSDGGRLHRLDPTTGRVTAVFDSGNVRDLGIGPDAVWITTDRQVIRIDPATNRIVARIDLPDAWGIAADGRGVVATSFRTHQLVRIDPARNEIRDRIDLGVPDPGNPVTTEIALTAESAWVVNGAELVRVALS